MNEEKTVSISELAVFYEEYTQGIKPKGIDTLKPMFRDLQSVAQMNIKHFIEYVSVRICTNCGKPRFNMTLEHKCLECGSIRDGEHRW